MGGAAATPFATTSVALGERTPLYLRVAPELALKQLVVGGLERVFEIGRVFRNEGIDASHYPEFTSCEFYQAYATVDELMDLTHTLLANAVAAVNGGSTVVELPASSSGVGSGSSSEREVESGETSDGSDDRTPIDSDAGGNSTGGTDGEGVVRIDFSQPYRRIDVVSGLEAALGGAKLPPNLNAATQDTVAALTTLVESAGLPPCPQPHTVPRLLDHMISELLEPQCMQPTFLTGHPLVLSPLARTSDTHPATVERFELFIGGREYVNAYTELNDPDEQRRRFEMQVGLCVVFTCSC